MVILLMLFNWSVEAFKWKSLMKNIQHFTFFHSLKVVFAGITIGIFTPNRIGEIGGRITFLEKDRRTAGVLTTSVGSYAQFIATVMFGFFGYGLLIYFHPEKLSFIYAYNIIFTPILIVLILILLWTYFNIKKIKGLLIKFKFFIRRSDQLEYLASTTINILIKVLLLSCLRYLIFISQFFLLLLIFNIQLSPFEAFISISLIYLFATIIPTTTLAELGIRGVLAIYFIGLFSENIIGIIAASFILWIINLAIPSIIGSVFFVKNSFTISE